jgi:polyphosphate kinase
LTSPHTIPDGAGQADVPAGSTYTFVDRELSWLSFSERVLQEAQDATVPLFERLQFCGIFSSNLDEFFRVRVASLRNLLRSGRARASGVGVDPHRLLHDIHRVVIDQQERYGRTLQGLFAELRSQGIRLVDDRGVPEGLSPWVLRYFQDSVRPHVEVQVLSAGATPFLRNGVAYLVVETWPPQRRETGSWSPTYVLVSVPSPPLPRFVTLPSVDDGHDVMFLDDVIRLGLPSLLADAEVGRSFAVKLTRDADLRLDDEFDGELVEAIRRSLKNRDTGVPSRFLYDMRAPYVLIHQLQHALDLAEEDLVLGGRYHNLHDYGAFPRFDREDLSYPGWSPHPHTGLEAATSVLAAVGERDRLLHFPYQSFDHVCRLFDEAAADPRVEEIRLTAYRVARDSRLLGALCRAASAGKSVSVFMEAQARFDEETNLSWAERLEAAGARILYPLPGLKVHAKIALVSRREEGTLRLYAYVGTGNFNERTAKVYADHAILTADTRVTEDVAEVFRFLAGEVERPATRYVLVAPFTFREGFYALIDAEASAAAAGAASGMLLKMNALEDPRIIARLYGASVAGVPIRLIVRGICRLVAGVPRQSESIEARSIVDRYLEHARVYAFHAGGEERLYLSSGDWMSRNLDRRVEVALPIFDPRVAAELRRLLDLQWSDGTKARTLDARQCNVYVRTDPAEPVRSQEAFRRFVGSLAVGHDA